MDINVVLEKHDMESERIPEGDILIQPNQDRQVKILSCENTPDKKTLCHHSTPEKQIRQPSSQMVNIPSPFKSALFWPEEPKDAKPKRSKEKIPSVVSSTQWKAYYKKKDNEKEEKKKKIAERQKKRAEAAK
ncbi:hypothetical protein QE152_g26615 [Popillia japonica]|uniref:Uncharacterized protein n=1 Tax=Popillia japonica TaxID=7064 RepID=A0AAW1JWL1_POPJA